MPVHKRCIEEYGQTPSISQKKALFGKKEWGLIKKSFVIVGVLLLVELMWGLTEGGKDLNHAMGAKDTLQSVLFPVALAATGGIAGTLLKYLIQGVPEGKNRRKRRMYLRIRKILKILLIFSVAFLASTSVLFAYTEHKIADFKNEKEYEEVDEAVDQNQNIEWVEENAEKTAIFDWKQDYYMEHVTQIVNDYDTADIRIRDLLLQYLSSEFVMNTENLEEYIKYTREANNISQKYLTYEYETEKMDSEDVKNISRFREKANEVYTDIDNLKLGGDAFVNAAKIYGSVEVENYEKALNCYIDALHAYYYQGRDNTLTAVGEKEIWLALKDTYLKISMCENLRDTQEKGAEKLAEVCGQMALLTGSDSK